MLRVADGKQQNARTTWDFECDPSTAASTLLIVAARCGANRHQLRASISSSLRSPGTMVIGIGKSPCRLAEARDQRAGSFAFKPGGQHQHGDIVVLLDHVEDLLRWLALADHAFRRDAGDAVGARRKRASMALASSCASARMMSATPSHCWFWSWVSMIRSMTTLPPTRTAQRLA